MPESLFSIAYQLTSCATNIYQKEMAWYEGDGKLFKSKDMFMNQDMDRINIVY